MSKYAIVDKSSYEVRTVYESDTTKSWAGKWGDSSVYEHVLVPANLESGKWKAQDDGGGNVEIVSDDTQKWDDLRSSRNTKLAASDYTQLADADLTALQVTDWATYRQELRDLPENTTDIDAVTWPTPPS